MNRFFRKPDAIIFVIHPDGRREVILASELKQRDTQRAIHILELAWDHKVELMCCGFPLKAKYNSKSRLFHACAVHGDPHLCGWFGLGAHSRGSVPVNDSSDGDEGVPASIQIDVGLAPLGTTLIDWEPAEYFRNDLALRQHRRSLAALIDLLLLRAGLNIETGKPPAADGMARLREAARNLLVNHLPSAYVLHVSTATDEATSFQTFVKASQASLAPQSSDRKRLVVVVGEVSRLHETSEGFDLHLKGLHRCVRLDAEVVNHARISHERAFFRINDPRESRVLAAASVWACEAGPLVGLYVGLALVSDRFCPAHSSKEVIVANQLAKEGIAFTKPLLTIRSWLGGVPDFLLACGKVVVEVAGLWSSNYLRQLKKKISAYSQAGKIVLTWMVSGKERFADFMLRVRDTLKSISKGRTP
jgi:hypothetical protein